MGVFLLIHIVLCIVTWVLLKTGVLASTRMIFPLVLLVPVWGFLSLLVLEFYSRTDHKENVESYGEKLLVEDAVHKNIYIDESKLNTTVAPLNEVLALNSSKTRRQLIMEVLYENPSDYISQLQVASVNDDTEVVHYAVTALVELQKEYDVKLQNLEKRLMENPEDEVVRREYLEVLEQYLESGMIEGNNRLTYLERYSRMLEKRIEKEGSFPLYLKKIKTDMERKDYDSVYRVTREMIERWPDRETGYLKMIEYYSVKKARAGIDGVLKAIRERDVYLSPEGRNVVKFWQKDAEDSFYER